MFGLLVSGRLVDTNFRQVDSSHAVIDVEGVGTFNHIVVFLTGQQAFPDGSGGAVYFSWPSLDFSNGGQPTWQYLGMISNQKPSAIFKIAQSKGCITDEEQKISHMFNQQTQIQKATAQLGISVEPLSLLEGLQQATMESEASMVPKFVDFTQKMVQSLFNFTASYAIEANEARMRASETYGEISSFVSLYGTFFNCFLYCEKNAQQKLLLLNHHI